MDTERQLTPKRGLTKARISVFLRELSSHGIAVEAARVASPGSKHPKGGVQSFRDLRHRDAEFAAALDRAVEAANAALEREIHRRGVAGFEEERIDSRGRVSVVRRYSDACLLAMARARLPGYARSDVAITGEMKHDHTDEGSRAIVDAVRTLADSMAADALPSTIAMLAEDS